MWSNCDIPYLFTCFRTGTLLDGDSDERIDGDGGDWWLLSLEPWWRWCWQGKQVKDLWFNIDFASIRFKSFLSLHLVTLSSGCLGRKQWWWLRSWRWPESKRNICLGDKTGAGGLSGDVLITMCVRMMRMMRMKMRMVMISFVSTINAKSSCPALWEKFGCLGIPGVPISLILRTRQRAPPWKLQY